MKRIVIVTLMLLLGNFVFGQNYTHFPTDFSTWSVYREVAIMPGGYWSPSMRYYSNDGDTIINGIEYQKIFKQTLKSDETLSNPIYAGGLREDDQNTIWYRSHNDPFPDTNERLLYRFNVIPGDTIYYTLYEFLPPEELYLVVIDTGQTTFGGEIRNTVTVEDVYSWTDTWIEGVGSLRGLFSLYCGYFEERWFLSCFHTNYIQLYQNINLNIFYYLGGLDPCYTSLIVGTDKIEDVSEIHIGLSPNPFTTTTTFEYSLEKPSEVTIIIYNSQGQVVEWMQERQVVGLQRIEWNAEGFSPGMYYYRVQTGLKAWSGKLIKLK